MSKVACPYCYRRIDSAKLHFQCTGRAAPGRDRCRKRVDDDRQRLTGYSGMSWPTFPQPESRSPLPKRIAICSDCRNSTGIRACPVCHTPLPANFAESTSPLIGMVGGRNAGKTVYTTVLAHELRHNIRRRFAADIWFAGDLQGGDGSVSDWLKNYEDALFGESLLFQRTPSAADGIKVPLVLQWRQPRRDMIGREVLRTTTLSFYDAAGEDMTSQEFVNAQAYLTSADGLIVLLDPFELRGAQDRIAIPDAARPYTEPPINVLNRITELLRSTSGIRARQKISVPIAVVFSKIDAFFKLLGEDHPLLRRPPARPSYDESIGRDTDEHLRALLTDLDADDIDAHLRSHYREFRYFAVSSLGAQPNYATRRVDAGGVRPFRVDEPLLWLLARFGIIDRSTA